MTRIATLTSIVTLAFTLTAQAGLDMVISAPTTTGGYDVYTISAVWDGQGAPLQTINYEAQGVNQEWYELVPGVTYLDTVASGSTSSFLVGYRFGVDSHVLLPVVSHAADYLMITPPSEDMDADPATASGPGSMIGNFGYKGAAPQHTTTDLFQIARPTFPERPLLVGHHGWVVMSIRLTDGDGTQFDFIVGNIPEPASMALIGLGGVVLLRRRRAA